MMSSPPSQFNYPLPKVSLTTSQVGKRITVLLGGNFQQDVWIEISNESPYLVTILSAQGILLNQLQPQLVDIAQIPSGDNSFVIIPNTLIPQSSPSSELDINVYPFGQPGGPYPFPLNRQSMSSAPTSQIGFVLTTVASPAAINQLVAYCIFNPANSGKIYNFYRITAVQNGATTFTQCGWVSTDPNFAFARTPLPQTSRTPQPTTQAHCTLSNTTDVASNLLRLFEIGGNAQEFMGGQADIIEIVPGTGLIVEVTPIPATSTSVSLNSQWLEQ